LKSGNREEGRIFDLPSGATANKIPPLLPFSLFKNQDGVA
jgi:hypothetical protein